MGKIWVLGAPDPEMERIEAVLRGSGEEVRYALAQDDRRVHPGIAYQTKAVSAPVSVGQAVFAPEEIPRGCLVIAVECDGPALSWTWHVDHHRPGDTGYAQAPSEYMAASSLGQTLALLGKAPTPEDRLIAAADHCLAAAYRGLCPDVDPEDLMAWRIESRATFQHRPVDEVLRDVESTRVALRLAPVVTIGGVEVADMRSSPRPELPEAASREGMAFLALVKERTGRVKVVLQSAPPEAIKAFLESPLPWGRGESYGDPARGLAGIYTTPADGEGVKVVGRSSVRV